MADERFLLVRRGLLLAGFAAVGWSVIRVVLLFSGNDSVVADDDRHGYFAIFSLVLLPVLVLAVVALVADAAPLWMGRSRRVGPGVALVLSAPLAGELVLATAAVGVAIIVAALVARRPSNRP